MFQTEKIDARRYDEITRAAKHGGYLESAVTLLTPALNTTELAQDASYLVIENAYTCTIIRLDDEGRPVAILEGE